jgi:Xaa-Pro aminopeptidase
MDMIIEPSIAAPFDTALLDDLMEKAGIDLLLATSKHSIHYFMDGHKGMFFEYMDAMGISRYLPVFVYARGKPASAGYIGHRTETAQREVKPFWTPHAQTNSWGSVDAIEKAMDYVFRAGLPTARIGIEAAFLPSDSADALRRLTPNSAIIDALGMLENLRACKTPAELDKLREASERVSSAMAQVFSQSRPGQTKQDLTAAIRRAETDRDLVFEYLLIAAGTSHNRAPSDQVLRPGDVISLDSGGNYHGYIGDIARMGILGEPDEELISLLCLIDDMQQAAFDAVAAGRLGGAVYRGPEALIAASPLRDHLHFVAHGMGLVAHEIPHLTASGPVQYSDEGAHLPLEPGMVLSIESTLKHPTRGFIKLEDTVVVTDTGYELFAPARRGWNRCG